jgi:DNA-binding MarR family transcriptional regulator
MKNSRSKGALGAYTERIFKAYNQISKSINPAQIIKMDLTSSQIKVLISFAEQESFTMTELSKAHSVSVSTMTSMVDRLLLNKLLRRDRDKVDRRVVRVLLTEKGKKIVQHLMEVRRQALEEFLRELNDQEIEQFLDSIEVVAQVLSQAKTRMLSRLSSAGQSKKEKGEAGTGAAQ